MATVTCGSGTALDMDSFNPISVSDYAQYTLIPTELRLFNNAQNYTSITGVNFAFNVITQEVTGGTVHGLKVVSNGAISFQVTGANASAVTLYSLGLANDALGIYSLLLGGNDAFTGSNLSDVLRGFGGNDVINGGNGADFLYGGAGGDTLRGDSGDDYLNGSSGADSYNGGAGVDRVSFYDTAATQGVIANLITQTVANDGFGNNELLTSVESLGGGTAFSDSFTGNAAANLIFGDLGDTIAANGGNDTFFIDGAPATLDGGAGNDTILAFSGESLVPDTNSDGFADVIAASTGVVVDLAAGQIIQDGFGHSGNLAGIENVGGGFLADHLSGDGAANQLTGWEGNDTLDGRAGGDILDGGVGNDTMIGGAGDDTYVVNAAGDVTTETSAAGGTDLVNSSVSRTLGANLENLTLTGSAAINGTGNALSNIMIGNSAANNLNGLGGADDMRGGGGNDTYIVNSTADMTTETSADGTDLVRASVTRTLGANLENLTLTGSTAINGTGNTLANILTGNAFANVLTGAGGADKLTGGNGGDTLRGGLGLDTLTGGNGADKFVFDTTPAFANRDVIIDFNLVGDVIQLDNAVFVGIGAAGALAAGKFRIGAAAFDATDRIIYQAGTGKLFFDADGNGAGAQIHFATLSTGLALTNADFVVI